MQAPSVHDLLKQLESAEPARRMEIWNRLRDAYRDAMRAELPATAITRSPSLAAIRLTYSRLPPVTVRHWGEFATVSMPWLAKKRIR